MIGVFNVVQQILLIEVDKLKELMYTILKGKNKEIVKKKSVMNI
jgi:hypothetical protein